MEICLCGLFSSPARQPGSAAADGGSTDILARPWSQEASAECRAPPSAAQEHMAQPPVEPPNTLNSILSFVCKQAHRQQQHRHHHAQKAAAAAAETQPQLQQQQAQLQQQAQPQQAKGRGAKLPSAVLPVKPAKGSRKPVLMSTASMPIQEATDPYDYEEAD